MSPRSKTASDAPRPSDQTPQPLTPRPLTPRRLARQRASAFLHAVELAQLRSKLADLHAQAVVPDQAQLDALTSATSTFERTHRDLAELETTLDERQSERDAIEINGAVLSDPAAITTLGQQLEARTQDRNRLALVTTRWRRIVAALSPRWMI
jgi:hypothetical protein